MSWSMRIIEMESGMKRPIQEPCHEDWRQMCGDEKKRFCEACQKNVHNLSEMTKAEANTLLKEESSLCICYQSNKSGHIRFRSALPLLAILVAGCDYVAPSKPSDSVSVQLKKNILRGSAHVLNRIFSDVAPPEASEEVLYPLSSPAYYMGVM